MDKKEEKSEYELQAEAWLEATNSSVEFKLLRHDKHFWDKEYTRDIYWFSLIRNGRIVHSGEFGQSIANSAFTDGNCRRFRFVENTPKLYDTRAKWFLEKLRSRGWRGQALKNGELVGNPPTAYDLLACFQKHNPGSFSDFCADLDYSEDSIKANEIYKAAVAEYLALEMAYTEDELAALREIN